MPGERLLVIDDSREARDFLEEFLGNQGYTVLTASDGAEGLLRALNEKPDVILVDMRMPEMSGLDVIEALNQGGPDIPIIFLTAHGSEQLVMQALRLGICDYIPKPYEPQTIVDSVERALRQARLRRERAQLPDKLTQANQILKQRLREFNALYSIGKSVTALIDLEQVVVRVVEAATYMAQSEEGSLMLLEEPDDRLVLRAGKHSGEQVARVLHTSVNDQVASHVISTGRPVLLAGAELRQLVPATAFKAVLMVPLQAPDRRSIGVLSVSNKIHEESFSAHDLHLLSVIADFAAVAIENAAHISDLQGKDRSWETILRQMNEAVLVIGRQGHVLLCNQTVLQALGLDERHVIGHLVQDVIPHQALLELLTRRGEAGSPQQTEVPLTDGRTLNACVSTIDGVGQAIVMQDITHLKELDRIKTELVSTVAHDLRTPLATIQGYVDLFSRAGPVNELQQEFIDRAQLSIATVAQLVSDLLEIGRIETGFEFEMETLDLGPVITEAVAELRLAAGAKEQNLEVVLPGNPTPLRGNPKRLRQVVSNLVNNAIKYTPPRGQIVVAVTEGDNHVTISVTDNGIGIPVADQPYVFDRFFRVDQPETHDVPGTGLGLSIVKSVVEKHGGRVWVESMPGEGSVFTLLLPKS